MKEKLFPTVSKDLIEMIGKNNFFIIVSHKNPDGDAIFSSLAFSLLLSLINKDSVLLNEGPFKREEIKKYESSFLKKCPSSYIEKNPLLVVLDCSTSDRTGSCAEGLDGLTKIVIDHHSSGLSFAEERLSYIVPSSPSTTLLVDVVRSSLGIPLSKMLAYYLFMGYATDTGFFKFLTEENASPSLERVKAFVDAGVSPNDVYDEINNHKDLETILAITSVIQNAKFYLNGKIAICRQKKEIGSLTVSDDVYTMLLSIENVSVVLLLKEKDKNTTEVSFRSKHRSNYDVGKIASTLGGGGHHHASGAVVKKGLDESEEILLALFEKECC